MPGVSVTTYEEFSSLEARVTKLEAGGTPVPPDPTPIPPDPGPGPTPPGEGTQAKRVADLIGSFGVNTFSSMDEHNLWGSWPADYRPASVIAALKFILGNSGHVFRIREYHYKGRESFQLPWLQEVTAAMPGTLVSLCVAANGSTGDVPSMLMLADEPTCNVRWIEGLNEGNTDFGSGVVSPDKQLDIQKAVWLGATDMTSIAVMGPSIVAGTPHPEGWITGYAGDTLPALCDAMDLGNGHYYPPASPDVPNTGYSVNDYIGGLWTAYDHHAIALTEFHPTLYKNSVGAASRDPYYTLMTLLRCAQNGTKGVWWYALFDYGTVYSCGLFPKDHANDPTLTALALKNLCAICADKGDRLGFAPGKLDISITGLNEAMAFDVYQASDGRFLVPIWYAAADVASGPVIAVTVQLGSKRDIKIYDPLVNAEVSEQRDNVDTLGLDLAPGVMVLEVS